MKRRLSLIWEETKRVQLISLTTGRDCSNFLVFVSLKEERPGFGIKTTKIEYIFTVMVSLHKFLFFLVEYALTNILPSIL